MIAPPFERVHYVQPCARGRGQILFAAINPENCREFIRKCIFPAGQQYQQHHWCASNEINWKKRTGNEMQATVPESELLAPEMLLGVAVLLYCNVQLHILAIAVGKWRQIQRGMVDRYIGRVDLWRANSMHPFSLWHLKDLLECPFTDFKINSLHILTCIQAAFLHMEWECRHVWIHPWYLHSGQFEVCSYQGASLKTSWQPNHKRSYLSFWVE